VARSKKAFVVSAAVAVTALGGAVGVSSLASADPTRTTTPTPSGGPSAGTPATPSATTGDHGPGRGVRGEQFAAELASKLGVAQDEVATALEEIREENQPTSKPDPSQRPDRAERDAALAKALAEKLNVDEAKVKAALDELRSERQAARAAALKERLDAAVKAGTLTQAEADAVQKAVDKGVIHADR
jgi:Spy/CpxP family protein refolding chaperone